MNLFNVVLIGAALAAISFLLYAIKHSKEGEEKIHTVIEESDGLFFVNVSVDKKTWINIGNRTSRKEAERMSKDCVIIQLDSQH